RRGRKLGHPRAALLLELRKLARDGAAGMPVEQAAAVGGNERPGRINHPVPDRPDDRRVEHPQPPARQRGIELLDAIPLMAGGAHFRWRLGKRLGKNLGGGGGRVWGWNHSIVLPRRAWWRLRKT